MRSAKTVRNQHSGQCLTATFQWLTTGGVSVTPQPYPRVFLKKTAESS